MIQHRYLTLLILLSIFFGSVYVATQIGHDFGGVSIKDVIIQAQGYTVRGTLYTPYSVSGKLPAFALAHGVSNAKETLSGLALELARNGYMALTVDEKGHGESDTGIGVTDSTLGLGSAVTYLTSLPNVDANRIGVAGHSMGAGAVRATVSQNHQITATVLIGGGQSDSTIYTPMNETQPRNLLFVVGRNDVLFNLTSLDAYLRPVFGAADAISPETTYGEFGDGTARRLVLLETIHLLEPVDPMTVKEVVSWANSALKPEVSYPLGMKVQTYLFREGFMAVALVAFMASIIPLSQILNGLLPGGVGEPTAVRHRFLRERHVLLLWSLLGLVLYLPGMFLGILIPFPPLTLRRVDGLVAPRNRDHRSPDTRSHGVEKAKREHPYPRLPQRILQDKGHHYRCPPLMSTLRPRLRIEHSIRREAKAPHTPLHPAHRESRKDVSTLHSLLPRSTSSWKVSTSMYTGIDKRLAQRLAT